MEKLDKQVLCATYKIFVKTSENFAIDTLSIAKDVKKDLSVVNCAIDRLIYMKLLVIGVNGKDFCYVRLTDAGIREGQILSMPLHQKMKWSQILSGVILFLLGLFTGEIKAFILRFFG